MPYRHQEQGKEAPAHMTQALSFYDSIVTKCSETIPKLMVRSFHFFKKKIIIKLCMLGKILCPQWILLFVHSTFSQNKKVIDKNECECLQYGSFVFSATFSNISAISWRPVLVVEEAGENHRSWASNW